MDILAEEAMPILEREDELHKIQEDLYHAFYVEGSIIKSKFDIEIRNTYIELTQLYLESNTK